MPNERDFAGVFARLKSILEPFAPQLLITENGPTSYSLDTSFLLPNGTHLYFGGVRIGKRYVSFYLMPVYVRPDLLAGLSPAAGFGSYLEAGYLAR